ncbi:unnamed protein product, partial [Rangifer tarandus platyrhynchus]
MQLWGSVIHRKNSQNSLRAVILTVSRWEKVYRAETGQVISRAYMLSLDGVRVYVEIH